MPGRSEALAALEARLSALAEAPVELDRPTKAEHGDYATNVALRSAPAQGRVPRELAQELAGRFVEAPEVARAEVAGPGFVNLWLEDAWVGHALGEILAAGDSYGAGSAAAPERVQAELVSANPTGPLTVGHARNGAYGDSVARVLAFAGHQVSREHYANDVGRQIELFRESVDARRRGEEPPPDGYVGDYVFEIAAEDGDPVALMLERIEQELERFRIHVDTWARQSEMQRRLPELLPRLDTYEAEGTLWARTSAYGDDKDRPLLRSSDGSYLYFAADVAYVRDKLERFDRAIYVLGADHHGYVRRLQAAAAMLGYDPACVEVLIYQLVHLVEAGEAKRVSKRRGDVVFLSELIEKIGVDAARWYLVSRGHDQTIEIDVDLAAEQSQKNPVYYVQYAHARIAGIMRNAGGASVSATPPAGPLAAEERDLVKRLVEFPEVAAEAADRRGPHALPTYAIRLADDFHRFYHRHRVLGSGESEEFRLGLCAATRTVIARALDLVGVEAPERM